MSCTLGDHYPRLRTIAAYYELAARSAPPTARTSSRPAAPRRPVAPWRFPARSPGDMRTRVGILSPSCYLGGAERWISDLLDFLDRSRVVVVGVAVQGAPGVPTIPTVRADWEAHCPMGIGLDEIRSLASAVDVLIVWGMYSDVLEQLERPGLRIVQVSHSALDLEWIHGLAAHPGAEIVACSTAALRGVLPSRRPTARVILNGVDGSRVRVTRPRDQVRAEWGVRPDQLVAGWLSRIAEEKRPELYLDALAQLPPEWVGVMAGAGLHRVAAEEYAARVAPGRIRFVGPREDVGDMLAGFDNFIMTTKSEACCLAIAEAWLAGVPTVSTPVGLLEERPELARLIPIEPTGADLAAAILADRLDADGTAARVAAARSFAETALSMERFGREWSELVAPRGSPGRRGGLDPAVRDAILACPDRGGVLPLSQQDSCGCRGKELSECRAGRGKVPGRVTLADCINCKHAPD